MGVGGGGGGGGAASRYSHAPASHPAPWGRAASVWSNAEHAPPTSCAGLGSANGSTSVCPPESVRSVASPGLTAAPSPQSPTESRLPPLFTGTVPQFDGPASDALSEKIDPRAWKLPGATLTPPIPRSVARLRASVTPSNVTESPGLS